MFTGSKTLDVKQRISWGQDADSLTCSTRILLHTEPGNSSPSYTTLEEFHFYILRCDFSSTPTSARPRTKLTWLNCTVSVKLPPSSCCQLDCHRLPENPLFLKQEKISQRVPPVTRSITCLTTSTNYSHNNRKTSNTKLSLFWETIYP